MKTQEKINNGELTKDDSKDLLKLSTLTIIIMIILTLLYTGT